MARTLGIDKLVVKSDSLAIVSDLKELVPSYPLFTN